MLILRGREERGKVSSNLRNLLMRDIFGYLPHIQAFVVRMGGGGGGWGEGGKWLPFSRASD